MKIKPSKKLGKLMVKVDSRTRPRVAAALFSAMGRLPAVRLTKIFATTDFSESSLEGVRYAVSLAEKLGASVALIHVVEPVSPFAGMEGVVLARGSSELVELAEKQVAKLAERQSKKGLAITSFVRHGKPFNEIVMLARSCEADLIVIATRGHTGLERIVLGSTAERVVRHAPCAVLTVPSPSAGDGKTSAVRLRKIVVPIDFSSTSVQALPYASALAERFGAKIILLHVIEPLVIPSELGYLPADIRDPGRISKQTADEHLGHLRQQVFCDNTSCQTLVRTGVPFQEITKAATSLGADMVILTTHGYTGLKRAFLGSTAERVVRHADCPVLVVREMGRAGRKRPLFRRRSRTKRQP